MAYELTDFIVVIELFLTSTDIFAAVIFKGTVEGKLLSDERLDFEDFGAAIGTWSFFKLGP